MFTKSEKRFQMFGNIVMIFMTILAVAPFLLVLISSLTSNEALVKYGYSYFPKEWSFFAYTYIFKGSNHVMRAYLRSFEITGIGVALSLSLTTTMAYALSRKGLPGRGLLTFYVFFTMLFNGGLVATYINYVTKIHIKDTIWALIIPGLVTGGFNILLMKSFFVSSIPPELSEAAFIDGATEYQTFWHVVIPLGKPIIATIGLFSGLAYWNDWNNALYYIVSRRELYGIQSLLNQINSNIQYLAASGDADLVAELGELPTVSVRMAIAVVGVLPVLLIYPFVQNNFVKGITLGGVKG